MNKHALITGICGQDGSYIAELLLSKGYTVYGLSRRSSSQAISRIQHLPQIKLVQGDLTDTHSLRQAILTAKPNEIYNLAAQSHVGTSFSQPDYTFEVNAKGVLNLLEAIRHHAPEARIFQASTSEMFGNNGEIVQTELSAMLPVSPYGVAKLAAHHICATYRRSYGLHISCGISFNHESPRRSPEFVTRKITTAIAQIKAGTLSKLKLGNLDARRDWSHAADIMQGAWLMLQQEMPGDYILASGHAYSVREFAEVAFEQAGLQLSDYLEIDPGLVRPTDIDSLIGDYTSARNVLGWQPRIGFKDLVKEMVDADLSLAGLGDPLPSAGPTSSTAPTRFN